MIQCSVLVTHQFLQLCASPVLVLVTDLYLCISYWCHCITSTLFHTLTIYQLWNHNYQVKAFFFCCCDFTHFMTFSPDISHFWFSGILMQYVNFISILGTKKELDSIKKRYNEVTEKMAERSRQYQKLQVKPTRTVCTCFTIFKNKNKKNRPVE